MSQDLSELAPVTRKLSVRELCPDNQLLWNGKRGSLERLREIARIRGGISLATEYLGAGVKHPWRCEKGHSWMAAPSLVAHSTWCPTCAGTQRDSLAKMQELAKSRGGECLSKQYTNSNEKLEWRCAHGHVWRTAPSVIKRGYWCPECSCKKTLTIEEMQELAKSRGGECLSTQYVNNASKLEWRCSDGHTWFATANDVKQKKTWCPSCNYKSEQLCRTIVEACFDGAKFPKARPAWLISSNGYRMELDGFNTELGLAFEYHGEQHSSYHPHFHKSEAGLHERQRLDQEKLEVAERNNVRILTVSFLPQGYTCEAMVQHVLASAEQQGIVVPVRDPNLILDNLDVVSSQLIQLQALARERGGECLSKAYRNVNAKLHWRCSEGHEWQASAKTVRRGHWCPGCAGMQRLSISDMQAIAHKHGGECLSSEYVNNRTHLQWRCKDGHTFSSTPDNVRNNRWCPYCYRTRLSKRASSTPGAPT